MQNQTDNSIWNTKVEIRKVFLSWEKLRLVYNLVLGVIVCLILFVGWNKFYPWDALEIVVCAIAANFCFFAGPFVDAYVGYLVQRRINIVRPILFCLGLIFSIMMTLLVTHRFWMLAPY